MTLARGERHHQLPGMLRLRRINRHACPEGGVGEPSEAGAFVSKAVDIGLFVNPVLSPNVRMEARPDGQDHHERADPEQDKKTKHQCFSSWKDSVVQEDERRERAGAFVGTSSRAVKRSENAASHTPVKPSVKLGSEGRSTVPGSLEDCPRE